MVASPWSESRFSTRAILAASILSSLTAVPFALVLVTVSSPLSTEPLVRHTSPPPTATELVGGRHVVASLRQVQRQRPPRCGRLTTCRRREKSLSQPFVPPELAAGALKRETVL